MRKPRAVVVGISVIAACVVSVKTSSFEQQTAVIDRPSYDFGTKKIGSAAPTGTLTLSEPPNTDGSDQIIGIGLTGSDCFSDFSITEFQPGMSPQNTPTQSLSGNALIWQANCFSGKPAGTGSSGTCTGSNYQFHADFTPSSPGPKTCQGMFGYMTMSGSGSGSMMVVTDGSGTFTLTGSGSDMPPIDARPDSPPGGDGAIVDTGSGSGGSGSGSGGSPDKLRETYYACSAGTAPGAAPVALALLALRRRRKLRR